MKSVLQLLGEYLEKGPAVLLIGGYALQAYGVVRQTLDVDFLVCEGDSPALGRILEGEGYREAARTETFVRYTHSPLYLMDVDLVLVDRQTFDSLIEDSIEFHLGQTRFRVPSLSHLMALKLHAANQRPERVLRDMSDIVALMRANPDVVSEYELQTLCARHGSEGIFTKLKEYL
jgi:hypothetical protein